MSEEQLLAEGWAAVHKFPGYYVSRDARIYSTKTKKEIKQHIRKHYVTVRLFRGDQIKYRFVHRIVCRAFHGPAPRNHTDVNHKDLNTLNNNDWNLEWATSAANAHHRVANGGGVCRKKKPDTEAILSNDAST